MELLLTCVNDVASLTEKGTSSTLASVRASSVLPKHNLMRRLEKIHVRYSPDPVGPLFQLLIEFGCHIEASDVHDEHITLLKQRERM